MSTTSGRRGEARADHVFVAPSPGRTAITLLMLLAATAAVVATGRAWQVESLDTLVWTGLGAMVAVACWVYLAVSVPQRVVVTGSVVEVRRSTGTQRYDLEDPGVDLLVRDGSVAIGHYRDSWSVVEARDVDWPVFMDIVMRYQSQADRNAEERDRRFSS